MATSRLRGLRATNDLLADEEALVRTQALEDRILGIADIQDPDEREAHRLAIIEKGKPPQEAPQEPAGGLLGLLGITGASPAEKASQTRTGALRSISAEEVEQQSGQAASPRHGGAPAGAWWQGVGGGLADTARQFAGWAGDKAAEMEGQLEGGVHPGGIIGELIDEWRGIDHTPRSALNLMLGATEPPPAFVPGAPDERSPRTLGVIAEGAEPGENRWRAVEAYIQSKVPATVDPSISRIVGQVAGDIGEMAAIGGFGAGFMRAAASGAVVGVTKPGDEDAGVAEWLNGITQDKVLALQWITDREGDTEQEKVLKNQVEEGLMAVLPEGVLKLAKAGYRAWKRSSIEQAALRDEPLDAASLRALVDEGESEVAVGPPEAAQRLDALAEDLYGRLGAGGKRIVDADREVRQKARARRKATAEPVAPRGAADARMVQEQETAIEDARALGASDEELEGMERELRILKGEEGRVSPRAGEEPPEVMALRDELDQMRTEGADADLIRGVETELEAARGKAAEEAAEEAAAAPLTALSYAEKARDIRRLAALVPGRGTAAGALRELEALHPANVLTEGVRKARDLEEGATAAQETFRQAVRQGAGGDPKALEAAERGAQEARKAADEAADAIRLDPALRDALAARALRVPAPNVLSQSQTLKAAKAVVQGAQEAPEATKKGAEDIVRDAGTPKTPDLDRAKREGRSADTEETLAGDVEVGTPDAARWARPLEAWTPEEVDGFKAFIARVDKDLQVGTTRGGQVTVRRGNDDYVLVGEKDGKPLFQAHAWRDPGQGGMDWLQVALERNRRMLRQAEEARGLAGRLGDTTAGQAAGEAAGRRIATLEDEVAALTAQVAARAAGRAAVAQRALEPLKDADLTTLQPQSPEVLPAGLLKHEVDASKVPETVQPAPPLDVSGKTRGSAPEDYLLERRQAEQLAGYTQRDLDRVAEAARKGGPDRPDWPRMHTEADVDAWIEAQAAKLPAKEGGLEKDLRVLRHIGGENVGEGLTAGQARAWVKLLNHSASDVAWLARAAKTGDYAMRWDAVTAFTQHRAFLELLRGSRTMAMRLFDSVNVPRTMQVDPARDEAAILGRMQDVWGGERKVKELIDQLATKTVDDEIHEAARATVGVAQKGKLWQVNEVVARVGIAGMLSKPRTSVLAIASNGFMSVMQVAENYIAASLRVLFRDDAEIMTFKAANADLVARISGLRQGLMMASAEFEHGMWGGQRMRSRLKEQGLTAKYDKARRSDIFDQQDKPYAVRNDPNRRPLEQIASITDRAGRAPFTVLRSLDMAAKGSAIEAYVARRAAMAASQRGLSGDEWTKAFKEMVSNPSAEVLEKAAQHGEDLTFAKPWSENETWMMLPMAKIGRGLSRAPLIGRLFGMPFITVPARDLARSFESIPMLGFAQRKVRDEWRAGGSARQRIVARQTLGGMMLAAFGIAAMSGNLTGGGSRNYRMRDAEGQVRPPYSVRIMGDWYRYDRIGPLGRLMGVAADIVEGLAAIEEEKDAYDALGAIGSQAIASVQHHMTEGSFLSSGAEMAAFLLDLFEGENAVGSAFRFAGRKATSVVPYNALIRGVAQGVDPVYRDARVVAEEGKEMQAYFDEAINRVKAQIPGLSDTLPLKRDAYGREIVRQSPFGDEVQGLGWSMLSPVAFHQDTNDPGFKAMTWAGWAPPPWPKRADGVPYTDTERETLAKVAGPIFQSMLARHIASGAFDGYRRAGTREAKEQMAAEIRLIHNAAMRQGRAAAHSVFTDWRRAKTERAIRKAREIMDVKRAAAMGAAP